jgi:hypothetical protein
MGNNPYRKKDQSPAPMLGNAGEQSPLLAPSLLRKQENKSHLGENVNVTFQPNNVCVNINIGLLRTNHMALDTQRIAIYKKKNISYLFA